jgi:hypothetical protein
MISILSSLLILNFFSFKQLQELDLEFREAHIDILKRFYLLFESIYKYVADYERYIEDLQTGVFIQLTVEVRKSNQSIEDDNQKFNLTLLISLSVSFIEF